MKKLYRVLGKLGFSYNDVLFFAESEDGKTIVVKREKICDHCTGARPAVTKDDEVTLFDFLSGLSADQQRAALVHLSVLWAEKQAAQSGT